MFFLRVGVYDYVVQVCCYSSPHIPSQDVGDEALVPGNSRFAPELHDLWFVLVVPTLERQHLLCEWIRDAYFVIRIWQVQ